MYWLDILFLVNLFADFFLLWLTAFLRRLVVSKRKLTGAALLGSLYVLLTQLIPELAWLEWTVCKMTASVLLLLVAFGYSGFGHLTRNLATFYCVSFLAGGIMYALHLFFQPLQQTAQIVSTASAFSVWLLPVGMCGATVILALIFRSAERTQNIHRFVARLSVEIDGHLLECCGLIDTGNHLQEPLTRSPVSLMHLDSWRAIVSESFAERIQEDEPANAANLLPAWHHRIALVPYRSVGRETGALLLAIRVDRASIEWQGVTHIVERAWIGITATCLHREHSYQAVIHPAYIQQVS